MKDVVIQENSRLIAGLRLKGNWEVQLKYSIEVLDNDQNEQDRSHASEYNGLPTVNAERHDRWTL